MKGNCNYEQNTWTCAAFQFLFAFTVLRIIGASNGGNVILKLKQPVREIYAYTIKSALRDSRRTLIRGLRQRFRHRDERKYGWIKKLRMVKVYEIGENQIKKSKKFQNRSGNLPLLMRIEH